LSDAEQRRARLVSDLAHELRTSLTILRGRLDGLADLFGVKPKTKALRSGSDGALHVCHERMEVIQPSGLDSHGPLLTLFVQECRAGWKKRSESSPPWPLCAGAGSLL
jgi:signal transduction histidine kinase